MLKTIWIVAKNTFRETIRDRILYSLIAFSILVIAASLLAASVSLGQDARVVQDFGITAMLVFLLIITIFVGTQLVYREVERKTIYLVLSKPVSREGFYLGKFVGLSLTLLVASTIMGAVFLALAYSKTHTITAIQLWAVVFMAMEAILVTALGMLFSAFTSPLASAVYTFSLALVGHAATNLLFVARKSHQVVKWILEFVYYAFPNLEKFNLRNDVVFNIRPDWPHMGSVFLYFVGYTVGLLLLGLVVIRKDEF